MAKNSITDYSKTAASNTDIQSVDIAEGCLPSGINNAIREIMADLADMNDGTVTLTSPSFAAATITGDLTVDTNTLKVDSTNNRVGIGTSSPSTGLHVYGSAPELRVQSTATNNGFIRFINTSGSMSVGMSGSAANQFLLYDRTNSHTAYLYAGGASGSHTWRTNNTERMRIDSSGNVGVGNSSPTYKLDVLDNSSGSVITRIKNSNAGTGARAGIFLDNDGGNLMALYATSSTYTGVSSWTDAGVISTSSAAAGGLIFNSQSSGGIKFQTSLAERMRIDSSGNVGIGTSSPSFKLDVDGEIRATNRFLANTGSGATNGYQFSGDGDTGMFSDSSNTLQFSTAGSERMRIDSSGKLLIGRTTSTLGGGNGSDLQIGSGASSAGLTIHTSTSGLGDIQFADGTTGADSYRGLLRYNHSSNHMSIYTNGTESARLESDADLHVDGNVVAYSTTISDIRLKKDIAPIEDAVTKVQQLNGCTFTYLKDDRKSAGLIAQDVEKVLPSAVIEDKAVFHGEEGETYKTVQYDQLIGLLVEAVKELKAEIEELKDASAK